MSHDSRSPETITLKGISFDATTQEDFFALRGLHWRRMRMLHFKAKLFDASSRKGEW